MPIYNRYQKLQKYYLGVPVDPPEYQKGESIETGEWETIEQCENIKEETESTKENVAIIT